MGHPISIFRSTDGSLRPNYGAPKLRVNGLKLGTTDSGLFR